MQAGGNTLEKKSSINWLKEGEQNTTFFHCSTIHHRMHNKITSLKKVDGTIIEAHKDIEREIVSFSEDLIEEDDHSRA